jgi:hypothetical protein
MVETGLENRLEMRAVKPENLLYIGALQSADQQLTARYHGHGHTPN